ADVAVGEQCHYVVLRQQTGQPLAHSLLQWHDSHAEGSSVPIEQLVHAGGVKLLGHRDDRVSAPGEPVTGGVPVAHVWERYDHAAPGRQATVDVLHAGYTESAIHLVPGHGAQREG